MSLHNLLLQIVTFTFAIDVMSLLIVTTQAVKNNQLYSTFITLAIVVFCGFVASSYAPALLAYTKAHTEYKALNRFAWYGSFMLIYYAAMYSIFHIHRVRQMKLSRISKLNMCGFLIMICLNGVQYAEQIIFNKNLFLPIYQAGIPSITILCSLLTAVYLVIGLFYSQKKKEGKSVWSL